MATSNAFEHIMSRTSERDFKFIEEQEKIMIPAWKSFLDYVSNITDVIEEYKKTGVEPNVSFKNWENSSLSSRKEESIKENVAPNNPESQTRTRPRRNAAIEASQMINHQSSMGLNAKLRRPTNVTETVYVKKEKLSIVSLSSEGSETVDNIEIKKEKEDMPAPKKPAPKSRKQTKTSKVIKQEIIEEFQGQASRDSDVVIQDVPVSTVDICDSDDDKIDKKTERSTRTKSKQQNKSAKRTRNGVSDDEGGDSKRSKSGGDNAVHNANNETYVATKIPEDAKNNMNATVVVEKPKIAQHVNIPVPMNPEDLLTDDESDPEISKKKPVRTKNVPKQVFSPFEQSPVKKKVEAFEKLCEEANALPPRTTRTKTRAQAKEREQEENSGKSVVKEKTKMFTPMASKFIPKACSTSTKALSHTSSNESLVPAKSMSALKASQAEYREREKRRKEKEEEALRKREALIHAQIEEKKRKREEKQIKAQQQREALEKEKMKALELQKLKDERHKQILQEQEERKQKAKEDAERKRMMVKMKAVEEKKKEEAKRLEELRQAAELSAKLASKDAAMAKLAQKQQQQREKKLPIYMTSRAPLLPTPDCYDSDDDRCTGEKIKTASWARDSALKHMQLCMLAAGECLKNSFFSRKATTPDLQEIFEIIDPTKLKRTSSAIWHKPPRYTMMPKQMLESFREDSDNDYD